MVLSDSPSNHQSHWDQAQSLLNVLSALSYRTEALDSYLTAIAREISRLLNIDWTVVTCCGQDDFKIMGSSIDLEEGEHIASIHGTLTQTVVLNRESLQVEDVLQATDYGLAPEGYRSYLGVPLLTPTGKIIGTVCCFGSKPRQFDLTELRTVELFAERAAIALDNYYLYQQQQDFNQALEVQVNQRTAELQAAQAKSIEQEKLAAIGQFASMIVHEIRNPVTTISLGLNALTKLDLTKRDRQRLALAQSENKRLQNLLEEILLYAKPQTLKLEPLHINHFLPEVIFSLRDMPFAQERKIKLIPWHSKIAIRADHSKIRQVMINLIRNAYEAIAPGETVTCSFEPVSSNKYLCISVHNGGSPIPQELIPQLTEPFVSQKSGGTGLGLAIVQQIIDAHQGYFLIQSSAVAGTTASFSLPNPIVSQ